MLHPGPQAADQAEPFAPLPSGSMKETLSAQRSDFLLQPGGASSMKPTIKGSRLICLSFQRLLRELFAWSDHANN